MKSITVPVSTEAMNRLDFDECVEGDLIEMNLDEPEFERIWNSGVFDKLNDSLGVNIDIYEDESLIGVDTLVKAKNMLEKSFDHSDHSIKQLLSMINKAIEYKTGIFFFF
ncbi:TPA: hypothetical protein PXQ99_001166 [Yersinia enterocolitica]|nr:hypothetical protein [Yersinia enterocolitica]HEG0618847.1 hypothetical protein [Yersinia enterocolitica]HEN3278940.1 hypothetical protein [Yersinia enterocolitica]